jgi:hypothetical protein
METGEFGEAQASLTEAVRAAASLHDQRLEADATLTRLLVTHHTVENLHSWRGEAEREARRALELLDEPDDAAILAKAWRMLGFVHGTVCQFQLTADALEHGIRLATVAQDTRLAARLSSAYVMAIADGPTPAPEAIARAEAVLRAGLVDQQAEAMTLLMVAPLRAMSGDVVAAHELVARGQALLHDLGAAVISARASDTSARIDLMVGDVESAEPKLRADYLTLTAMDERYFRPIIAGLLGNALYLLGRLTEVETVVNAVHELASSDDVEAQALLGSLRARLFAVQGRHDEARELARGIIELVGTTDSLVLRADTLADLADALSAAPGDRLAVLEEARELYARKGHVLGVARVEAALAAVTVLGDVAGVAEP